MEINAHAWNLKKGNAKQHHAESFYFPLSVFDYVIAASHGRHRYIRARVFSNALCTFVHNVSATLWGWTLD